MGDVRVVTILFILLGDSGQGIVAIFRNLAKLKAFRNVLKKK